MVSPGGKYLRARSGFSDSTFRTHFQICVEDTVLFQNVDMENDGMLILDLTKTVNVARGSR